MAQTAIHALFSRLDAVLRADTGASGLFDSSSTDAAQRIDGIYQVSPTSNPPGRYLLLRIEDSAGLGMSTAVAGVPVSVLTITATIVVRSDQAQTKQGHDRCDAIARRLRDRIVNTALADSDGWTFGLISPAQGAPAEQIPDRITRAERFTITATTGGYSLASGIGAAISGTIAGGAAFSLVTPFGFAISEQVEVVNVRRRFESSDRFAPSWKRQTAVLSFWPRAGGGSAARIPVGRKLTALTITLQSGLTYGLADGSTAIINSMDMQASKQSGEAAGRFQIIFSGDTNPAFGPSYAEGEAP